MIDMSRCVWDNLESPWLEADLGAWKPLTQDRTPLHYAEQETIFWQNEGSPCLYIVASGRVCISRFHSSGQERHIYIACPGAMIGESACILNCQQSTTATAIVDSTLYCIPYTDFGQQFRSDPALAQAVLQYMVRKSEAFVHQIALQSFERAEQRIARTLIYLCDCYGKPVNGGIQISIHFTCSDVASIVNTSRVTVNNAMSSFAKQDMITKLNGYYIIKDLEKLQSLAAMT